MGFKRLLWNDQHFRNNIDTVGKRTLFCRHSAGILVMTNTSHIWLVLRIIFYPAEVQSKMLVILVMVIPTPPSGIGIIVIPYPSWGRAWKIPPEETNSARGNQFRPMKPIPPEGRRPEGGIGFWGWNWFSRAVFSRPARNWGVWY